MKQVLVTFRVLAYVSEMWRREFASEFAMPFRENESVGALTKHPAATVEEVDRYDPVAVQVEDPTIHRCQSRFLPHLGTAEFALYPFYL
jgi:hypothetical protein